MSRPRPGYAPDPRGTSTGPGQSTQSRWVPDNKDAFFVAALVWFLIGVLVVRWDWLDPASAESTLAVGQSYGSNPLYRIIKLSLLALSTLVVLRRIPLAWLMLRNVNAMFLAFVVLVPVSTLWSISPGDTSARFVSLISVVQVCFAFTLTSWHPRRFQQVIRPLITVILIGSVIVGVLMPGWVIEKGEGTLKDAWHGLLSSKNSFGQAAGFGVILWLHAWLYENVRWSRAVPFIGLSIACLLLSRSSTSLLAAVFSVLFMLLLLRLPANLRRYLPWIVVSFSSFVIVYGLAVLNLLPGLELLFAPIAALTGKDTTFSNRSEIWKIIEEHIAQSPIFGTGYGAYWIGPVPNSPSSDFLGRMYFYPYEAHNGYLEIVNDLGYIGLICLIGYIVIYVRQSVSLMKTDRSQAVLLLALFFQQALINLSESTWLNISAPYGFIMMTLATFAAARMLLDRSLRAHFGPGR
jgi:exopolysaccharide production protein ExoQ